MVTDVHLHMNMCMCAHTKTHTQRERHAHAHSQTPEYRVNLRTEYFIQDGKAVLGPVI